MCVCVCMRACIKLGIVTATDMRMHHVFIILTLTFIQGQPDLNHGNNKCASDLTTFLTCNILDNV